MTEHTRDDVAPAPLVVAVDGPSGSGKSSVSKAVARRLGAAYLDTGAMYRAVAWHCLNEGVDLADAEAVAAAAVAMDLDQSTDPDVEAVRVGGTDVTEAIRATLQNVNRIVADNQQSVKNSLKNLEVFTEALARNSEKIDNVMVKVDGVMAKADNLMLGLNAIAGGNNGSELNQMVKSIRELADNIDKRSNLLINDGRRTLADIAQRSAHARLREPRPAAHAETLCAVPGIPPDAPAEQPELCVVRAPPRRQRRVAPAMGDAADIRTAARAHAAQGRQAHLALASVEHDAAL